MVSTPRRSAAETLSFVSFVSLTSGCSTGAGEAGVEAGGVAVAGGSLRGANGGGVVAGGAAVAVAGDDTAGGCVGAVPGVDTVAGRGETDRPGGGVDRTGGFTAALRPAGVRCGGASFASFFGVAAFLVAVATFVVGVVTTGRGVGGGAGRVSGGAAVVVAADAGGRGGGTNPAAACPAVASRPGGR